MNVIPAEEPTVTFEFSWDDAHELYEALSIAADGYRRTGEALAREYGDDVATIKRFMEQAELAGAWAERIRKGL